ncbi:MAG: NAD(+)/NADH kinase [Ignavibacteriae bacterium]|nr:NAD(+)/NADH kinase [Ignavibacteriota bacterium]
MTFGIIGNPTKKNIGSVMNILLNYLSKNKIRFYIHEALRKNIPDRKFQLHAVKPAVLFDKADIIISLGGDGTFLNSARIIGRKEIPILGVNLGNLGFMAEVSPNEIKKSIRDILKGNYKIFDLCVLSAKTQNGKVFYGMNEIVIDKCNSIKMIEIEIIYKNERVVHFVGDGLIVSTPTGSTGYSLSAGGPIISPYSKVFIITPICPHTLNFRPIIVPDDGIIMIKTHDKEKVRITADGFESTIFTSPASFELKRADFNIKVVKKIDKTYFQTLNNKLLWGADTRKF